MNKELSLAFLESWNTIEGINTTKSILDWIKDKNSSLQVSISKNRLSESNFWFFDSSDGKIKTINNSFFSIAGLQIFNNDLLVREHPVILQEEIGYLGIICKMIEGKLHFLMQAKIEPGNINKIQISPTIQATKSNFTQKHGGNKPPYLEYFLESNQSQIIVDQIQSEQSSRFYKKRNRNIIILVDKDIELLPSHAWLTLGQIKKLMRVNNLVNMDTRTVLSCIPWSFMDLSEDDASPFFKNKAFCRSVFNNDDINLSSKVFNRINDFKMFNDNHLSIVPLNSLSSWSFTDYEISSKTQDNFKVVFCNIEIEGREVRKWTQPLFEATGIATFVLIQKEIDGKLCFLVRLKSESGCFDKVELGPSIQLEPTDSRDSNSFYRAFFDLVNKKTNIVFDGLLSEEGGRFYCEQNRNIILDVSDISDFPIPNDCFWLDFKTLSLLAQFNNVLNIQLRNLLSLLAN